MARTPAKPRTRAVKRINLALQGGGAHGAFTWGVLDRLLEEDDIEVAAISGTSAGALNGAAFKAGMLADGRAGAKANLDWLWGQVGAINDMRIAGWMQPLMPPPAFVSHAIEYSLPYAISDAMTRVLSPYAYGPFYRNPLQRIVDVFAYDKICARVDPALFVSTTNVRTGKIRVFEHEEISTDVILASACLPTIFQAVEIDDPKTGNKEAFWDGGYTGNPALFPLFPDDFPNDILVVNINPLERDELPVSPQEILNRINEISFNSSLLRELRAIRFVHRLIAEGRIPEGAMADIRVHMVSDDDLMTQLSVATKTVPSPYVLAELKKAGRRACADFLEASKRHIGKTSSIDLEEMFG
ncbi:MAG: patatin-like phospholipase family protein [Pseudomonadota bacterium]